MQRVRLVFLVAALSAVLTGVALAAAKTTKTTPPLTIGRSHEGYSVDVRTIVDRRGTVNAVWVGVAGTRYVVDYARKTAKAKAFTHVKLPDTAAAEKVGSDKPAIFQTSSGALEIFIGDFGGGFYAWRSTNDGVSWKTLSTRALAPFEVNGTAEAKGLYLASSAMASAPGGPIVYAGNNGDPAAEIVQLKSDLSGVTQIGTNSAGLGSPELARALNGTTYLLGQASTTALTYQAGTHSGTITFPCATGYGSQVSAGNGSQTLAAGRSVAVAAFSGCKHVWVRTISPSGAVGPLTTIGAAPPSTANVSWVAVAADSHGAFTAAFTVAGGDLAVAHSTNGSRWTVAPGFVPVAGGALTTSQESASISAGESTWYTADGQGLKLSDTYRTPPAPSPAGVPDPRTARIGSLVAVVPRQVALKSFRKTGETTVSVEDAIAGPVTVAIADSRTSGQDTIDVCQGGITKPSKLKAYKSMVLKLSCGSGAIVIGGTAAAGVDAKKGDLLTFTITDRGQVLTLASHVK
jgi:hypothetical protein